MIYLDTSALLKLYVKEPSSASVQTYLSQQEDPLPLSEILEMELINALRLKVFWGDIQKQQADEQIALFESRKKRGFYYYPEVYRSELMATFRKLSESTPQLGCRSLDILHLAYAQIFGVQNFVTFDARQRTLAVQVGFDVPTLA
jgi:predicted nucleic acid-binding protein